MTGSNQNWDEVFGTLVVGSSIDIQRSDGRIHSAVVAKLNDDVQSLTVEWFEKGDTKGKEIEIEAARELNPQFFHKPVAERAPARGHAKKPAPQKVENIKQKNEHEIDSPREATGNQNAGHPRVVTRQSARGDAVSNNRKAQEMVTASKENVIPRSQPADTNITVCHNLGSPHPGGENIDDPLTNRSSVQTKIPTTRRSAVGNKKNGASRPNSVLCSVPDDDAGGGGGAMAFRRNVQPAASTNDISRLDENIAAARRAAAQNPSSQAPPPAASAQNAAKPEPNLKAGRKSNCVKEVERLEKEREERRARQVKKKEEKEQIISKLNNDGNNPNWEFYKMILEFQQNLQFNPLIGNEGVIDHQICVAVRKRPMSVKEKKRNEVDVATIPDSQTLIMHEPKVKVDLTKYLENQTFHFDYSFDEKADNRMVYKYTAQPLVRSIFEGGMATCFAYGQTGSGKTHTMGGDFAGKGVQDSTKGIYAYAAQDVFTLLASGKYAPLDLVVSCSFFEIYSAKVFDLVNDKKRLQVLEDGKAEVHVKGLMEVAVESVDDIMQLIHMGNTCRTSGTTSMNNHSSRSHAVFQIILRPRTNKNKLHGKLSLIDLAGNERGKDTICSDRGTRMEGAEINKSLLALKECIRALGKNGAHLPFRSSKLTQVLRDSFIGDNARTCMIAMISPCFTSCEHTLNTLRYADRVKELGAADVGANQAAAVQPDDDVYLPSPPGSGSKAAAAVRNGAQNGNRDSILSNGSDLDLLRTRDENDMEEDWYAVLPLCDELRDMEESLYEHVRSYLENEENALGAQKTLYNKTNDPDYDVDDFSLQMEKIVDVQLENLLKLKEELANIRLKIKQEEEQANQIATKKSQQKNPGGKK